MSVNMVSQLSAIQMVSGANIDKNLSMLKTQLKILSPKKDQLVLLPENALCFADKQQYLQLAEPLGEGKYQQQLSQLAQQFSCYLICGSFPILSDTSGKIYTTSLVFSPMGKLISHYHKIHLFDAIVADKQKAYKESDTFIAGNTLQLFKWQTPQGCFNVGLAICYDLRFPALFQSLRAQGADIILLPAAFTQVTGKAHWHALLRARAIENQCYIVAANQGGLHACARQTYGHSMIVCPWGEVLGELPKGEGVVSATLNIQKLHELRQQMPIITHNRFDCALNN